MKRVRINKGKAGLVFKRGEYKRVLTRGTYWLGLNKQVVMYDMSTAFAAPRALEILLEDKVLAKMLHVVEVADNQLVLVYQNKRFLQVLTTGRYTYWNTLVDYTFTKVDLSKIYIIEAIDAALFGNLALSRFIRTFEVAAYEKAVLLVDDEFVKVLGGGTYRFWKNNTSVKVAKVDMRQLQLEMTGQELLTKDKATVRINFFADYRVTDVVKAKLDNKDFEKQLYIALQLALRAYVGRFTLDELLENKAKIGQLVFDDTKAIASKLGVVVLSTGIRDVILTGDMKEIMNQVLVAQKKAQANVITRREETASTRSLLNTAKLMEDNEMLFKLKEMEYIEKIAQKIGEITVTGNGNAIEQLKDIFKATK